MKQIFINLPVKDVVASMAFYKQLGFVEHPLFSFNNQKCMAWGEQIYLMLQSYDMFRSSNKTISNPKTNTTATFTLPVESIEEVNSVMRNGINAGGIESRSMVDEEFMKVRNLEDLDGHHWAIIYLNVDKFKEVMKRN